MSARVRAVQRVAWSVMEGQWVEVGPVVDDVAVDWIDGMVIVETIDPETITAAIDGETLMGAEYVLRPRWGGGERYAAILAPDADLAMGEARGLVRDIFRYLSGAR